MARIPLRLTSLLAEPQHSGYRSLCQRLTEVGLPTEFVEVQDWAKTQRSLEYGQVDLAAICGLLYVLLRAKGVPLKAVACPLLIDARHSGTPEYWADVVVREDSGIGSFAQLQGRHWLLNEEASLSGCRAFLAELSRRGLDRTFVGESTVTGSHASSLRTLLAGGGDYTVLDSTFLESLSAEERKRLRTLVSLGPMPAPLLVARNSIDLAQVSRALTGLESPVEPFARFESVSASDYRRVETIWNESCEAQWHRHDQTFHHTEKEADCSEFTRTATREKDQSILAEIASELPQKLHAEPTRTHSNGVDFFLCQRGGLERHTYLMKPEKLRKGPFAVVGFLSLMKEDGDLAALFEADDRLLEEFHRYDGFLSYSPTEYAPGRWANLAVFENLQDREIWAANSIHLNAIKELGSASYRNVRLHLGTWESLSAPITWLATRYLDYSDDGLRRSVHLF